MKKAYCVICGKPAKRVCPLEDNRPVCSLCCSEQVQYPHSNCPEECPYWEHTFKYLEDKLLEKTKRLIRAEPSSLFKNLSDQEALVFFVMFKAINYALKEKNDFTDGDLLSALSALRSELIASRSRLIYDSTPLSSGSSYLFSRMQDYLIIKPPEDKQPEYNKPEEFILNKSAKSKEPKEFVLNQFAPASIDNVFNLLERLIQRHHTPDQKGFIKFFHSIAE